MSRKMLCGAVAALCLTLAAWSARAAEGTVVLFAARATAAEKEVIRDFEAKTGIAVRIVEGKADELIDRLANPGDASGADLFMTVDGGLLDQAKQKGVFGKTDSSALRECVPVGLRDDDNAWVGVTTRARIIAYSKDRVTPAELSTYMDLADPKWKGRLLVRSSGNLYNQSLVASFLALHGEAATETWVAGVAANLARDPKGGDRDQAKGIAEGVGDVAIMNSYYLGHMLKSDKPEEVAAAESVGVFFPDQGGSGTHINICGIGLVRDAPNAAAALRLVEHMLSVPAQEALSAGNFEFPVNPKAAKAPLLAGWGDFQAQRVDFADFNRFKARAKAILDASSWK